MKSLSERICNVIMIALMLLCITYVADVHDRGVAKEQEFQAMRQEYMIKAENESAVAPVEDIVEPVESIEEPVIYCDAVIDFVGLREENKDVYAWLQIPGTSIDYPVLQSEEDNYYLNRNIDYSEGYPGSIYSNKCNAKDFSDAITVLYGHNMKNGTMFAGLHNFREADFFTENDQIIIYTEKVRFTYRIYIAAVYGDAYIPAFFDVTKGESAVAFCEDVEAYGDNRKMIREGMEITEEDCLLTLSTCVANEDTKRYLVIGKLEETAYYYE